MRFRCLAVTLTALACAATAACGSSDEDGGGSSGAAEAPEEILVAAPMELSGPVADAAKGYLDALQFGVDKINAAGGIKSLDGAELRLLVQDTQSDPAATVPIVRDMEGQGAVAVVGPLASGSTLAMKPTLERLGLPWLGVSSEPSLTAGGQGIMWRVDGTVESYVNGTFEFLETQEAAGSIEPIESIGILSDATPPSPEYRAATAKRAEANGWEVVAIDYDFSEQQDYASFVARLRDADVDLVTGLSYPPDAIAIAEAVALQDWRPDAGFLWYEGFQVYNAFRQAAGEDVRGQMASTNIGTMSSCDSQNELSAEFEQDAGVPLSGTAGGGVAVMAVLAAALEKAASADTEALREALATTEVPYCEGLYGQLGGVRFDENGENVAFKPTIVQFEGEFGQTAVAPDDAAAREPEWPAN